MRKHSLLVLEKREFKVEGRGSTDTLSQNVSSVFKKNQKEWEGRSDENSEGTCSRIL